MSVEVTERGLTKARLEALTDGVFAIVMTLLVLDFKVPMVPRASVAEDLPAGLQLLWPKLVSYVISFVLLGVYWIGHHAMFHYIKRSDRAMLWINMGFMMAIVFIPFSAALMSEYGRQPVAVRIYGYNQLAAGLSLYAQWWYATRRGHLVDHDLDPGVIRAVSRRILTAPLCYSVAIVVSRYQPLLCVLIYALVPLFYFVPGRTDRHWRATKAHSGH